MEHFKIINRFNGTIICEDDDDNFISFINKQIKSRADLSWANLSGVDLSEANLSGANLSGADLSRANLSGVDLSEADLSRADLSWANLSGADLSRSDLSWANLSRANLSGADLDYACPPFQCPSLQAKYDDKIRIQYLYHAIKTDGIITDPDLKELFGSDLFKKVANKFHRVEECGRV